MTPSSPLLSHRGFGLAFRAGTGSSPARYAYVVTHRGRRVHASAPGYRTAVAAERAARQFVDDALRAFAAASACGAYSSSK